MIEMVLSLTALFCAGITAIFSILAYAEVVGMKRSKNSVQLVPASTYLNHEENNNNPTGEELVKKFYGDLDLEE